METSTADRLKKALSLRNMKQIELSEKTGIGKSAISQYMAGKVVPKQDKVYLIAHALDVSEGWLMGYDVPMNHNTYARNDLALPKLNKKDNKNIEKLVDNMKEQLLHEQGLMFDGKPASPEAIQSILDAMTVGMSLAKQRNKAKYTPKKYRKEE